VGEGDEGNAGGRERRVRVRQRGEGVGVGGVGEESGAAHRNASRRLWKNIAAIDSSSAAFPAADPSDRRIALSAMVLDVPLVGPFRLRA